MKGLLNTTGKAFTGFLILAIVFGAGGYFIYHSLDDLDPAVQRIRDPNNTIRIWRETNSITNDALTSMRRYLLTGDTGSLAQFERSHEFIGNKIDTLHELAGADSSRYHRADTLLTLLENKLEESTLGAIGSGDNSQMSIAIDKAVRDLALMERKREQESQLLAGSATQNDSVTRNKTADRQKPKTHFWQNMFGKSKNRNNSDTAMDITQIAGLLDSMIVADTAASNGPVTDTLNHALKIAQELTSAKTRDFETREAQLKEELALLGQRRTTDSLISELTLRMTKAEQETMADLIGAASAEVKSSTSTVFSILGVGAGMLILLFTFMIRVDVRRSNKLREQIERARENAERLAKTREDFAANMSHEIRSPLNSIMGISEQLSKNPGAGNQKLVDGLLSASQHLLGLINPVLDVTKLNSGKIEFEVQPFSIRETLNDVQRAFRVSAAEKVISLDLHIHPGIPTVVMGDDVRLRQILFNLVGNAIKFTDKGSVSISCEDTGIGADGKHLVRFKVKDTGIGIETNAINRIFDEYSQAHSGITRRYGGTGLGLSISRKLIEQQNGSITVKSQPGAGSEFTFEIPYPEAQPDHKSFGHNEKPGQDLAGKKILVCDDEEMNRMLAGMIISNYGGTVVECGSGEEVVNHVRDEDFDLVLLDINLPGMDGKRTLATIRALGKKFPAIAVTGNAHEEPSLKQAGFNAVIIKPYQESELLEIIARLALMVPNIN